MFAEDAGLLPEKLFETVLDKSNPDGTKARTRLADLFQAMQKGGDFALETIPWFNGGLFKDIAVPDLETADVVALLDAARMNWNAVEPAILGTLFERGLNPDMRSQLGAHYTDPATILKLIRPVVEAPLAAEWQAARAAVAREMDKYHKGGKGSQAAHRAAQAAFIGYLERLKSYRVLDPACGSGNFLYLALKTLKDLEHRANLDAEALGLHRQIGIDTGPANVLGIELNPYAAELARATVWIGELQWMLGHGYAIRRDPILRPLDHIEQRDAVLELPSPAGGRGAGGEGSEPEWPAVDAIVGNPPFLGDKKMRSELGDGYTDALRELYFGRVPGGADLVTYWFEKARAHIEQGKAQAAGMVATNSIRGGASRKVLDRILATPLPPGEGPGVREMCIFDAWSDEEWVNNGAAVRVSLVCFGHGEGAVLDGQPVATIHADLTAAQTSDKPGVQDLTQAQPLPENAGSSFFGLCLAGSFKLPQEGALAWMSQPNPNGRPNSDVLKPIYNGVDITRRWKGDWVIDFGASMGEADAALYELPFAHVVEQVKPVRAKNNRKSRAEKWWRHGETRPGMRARLAGLSRYIATPETAKHRFFVWFPCGVAPEHSLIVIARDDDVTFGILSARFHVAWALAKGGRMGMGNDPRYNSSQTFETFPFPPGLTPDRKPADYANPHAAAIAAAAQRLDQLRNNWLNPPEWVDWVRTKEEEQAGFPPRPVAKPGHEAELKKRTLTNLYNARPAWLANAHEALDRAVAAAYGWDDYSPDMAEEEILRRLLALNRERSATQAATGVKE